MKNLKNFLPSDLNKNLVSYLKTFKIISFKYYEEIDILKINNYIEEYYNSEITNNDSKKLIKNIINFNELFELIKVNFYTININEELPNDIIEKIIFNKRVIPYIRKGLFIYYVLNDEVYIGYSKISNKENISYKFSNNIAFSKCIKNSIKIGNINDNSTIQKLLDFSPNIINDKNFKKELKKFILDITHSL